MFHETFTEDNIRSLLVDFDYDISKFNLHLQQSQIPIETSRKSNPYPYFLLFFILRCDRNFESRVRKRSNGSEDEAYFGTQNMSFQRFAENLETQRRKKEKRTVSQ